MMRIPRLLRHLAYEGPRHRVPAYVGRYPQPRDVYSFLPEFTQPQDQCTTPDAAGPARTAPTTTDPFPHGPDMHAVALRYFQSQPGWVDPTTLGPS
jgi:hypothetical protein